MADTSMVIRKPDDMHLHLRQDQMLATAASASAVFARAVVMPNLKPPIDTVAGLDGYRNAIESYPAAPKPLMTFQITETFDPSDAADLKYAGAVAAKLYPRGVTTNSEKGWSEITALFPVFEALRDQDLVLSLHGEMPDAPVLERELRFLPVLRRIAANFPRLRIVLEHISRAESAELIRELPGNVAATITLHHIALTTEALCGGVFRPHLFCKPIVQSEPHRRAVFDAALSGSPKFFFGSDSAPHPRQGKEGPSAAAGIFSAPVVLPKLAELFAEAGRLDALGPFVSRFGAEFYHLEPNHGEVEIARTPWTVPMEIGGVVPLYAGESVPWSVTPALSE